MGRSIPCSLIPRQPPVHPALFISFSIFPESSIELILALPSTHKLKKFPRISPSPILRYPFINLTQLAFFQSHPRAFVESGLCTSIGLLYGVFWNLTGQGWLSQVIFRRSDEYLKTEPYVWIFCIRFFPLLSQNRSKNFP